MPWVHLKWEEHKKVFWELIEVGPVTILPNRIFILSPAHIRLLNERGVKYTVKDPRKVRLPKPKLYSNRKRANR
ncbi:MAG: hypothetical protein NZT92_09630 [Abditibacteriales bacterium]|nr:hypothetical protein [Abditibacteriales bacterium]MDW8367127.1 hypothetical protein [Abditibacteriales bacterium]